MFSATIFAAEPRGEIVAEIGFDPKINGFGFRNFGENPDYEEDLTADDMIRMFGAEKVCIEGSTARDCVLYETAERWMEEAFEKMNGGHCDGFSVASLRMFAGRPHVAGPRGFRPPAEGQNTHARNEHPMSAKTPYGRFRAVAPEGRRPGPIDRGLAAGGRPLGGVEPTPTTPTPEGTSNPGQKETL